MKRLSLLIFLLLAAIIVWAVPAERLRLKVLLNDGSEIAVTTYGDEHYSCYLSDEGEVIVPSEENPKVFRRTGMKVEDAVAISTARRAAARRIGSQSTAPLKSVGAPKVPVVLVNFQDSTFSVGETNEQVNAYYDLYCNGTRDGKRYMDHGSFGSVRDYFLAQSDSLLQPEFEVIGPVTVSGTVATYGANGGSKDVGFSSFRKEVVNLAMKAYDGDWSDFDNQNKNQVDMLFIIYAGCGENTVQGNTNLIWPKELTSPITVTTGDNSSVVFATFGCCSENRGKVATDGVTVLDAAPDGIGVMCHELSHALGLPDFYDTNYKGFGMDLWSLMDYGCYMQNGYCPVAYTAYERDFMGWRPLREITEPGTYTLDPIASPEGEGLKIVNPANANEYYVLEARLPYEWDKNLARMGKGLQVTHVDFSASAWNRNTVNATATHQRMTIIAANNRYIGSSVTGNGTELRKTWSGNLYPYVYEDENGVEQCNDSLTATSVPAATLFTEGYMPHTVTQIRIDEDNNQVNFLFDGEDYDGVTVPFAKDAEGEGLWYDLSGRAVGMPATKGLYLKNGHKVILK
ncbi:MAG: M6 family metalloprotease domain-containing protein [Bacteroidaceae bacterium]|nr:M6 family metalloprotease domain-containing protein [Bacteroidaceae bacterium]